MLHNQFENYLLSLGISPKSIKNYKSDISHFLGWAILKLKTFGTYVENLSELVPFLNRGMVLEYKEFVSINSVARKTINRRLSTLRQLSKFLITSEILDFDFMEQVKNIEASKGKSALSSSSVVKGFISHLEAGSVSKNTIKNYASDVRQFLSWLESNHARFA